MKISCFLFALASAHGAMASKDAGLRAVAKTKEIQTPERKLIEVNRDGHRVLMGVQLFTDESSWRFKVSEFAGTVCPWIEENFDTDDCGPVPDNGLTGETPNRQIPWKTNTNQAGFDTRSDECVFKDQVDKQEETKFYYNDMEAFGGYFTRDPLGAGGNLDISIYVEDTLVVQTLNYNIVTEYQFFGVIADKPFDYVKIMSSRQIQETYDVDDFTIYPWCSPMGGDMHGDPHVKTWGGDYFDFMGECDLVYLHDEKLDIDLHARTTIREDFSYVESAALRIGEDILEVGSYGSHALNGVDDVFVDAHAQHTVGGYPIYYNQINTKLSTFDVVLNSQENITFTVHKDIVSIRTAGDTSVVLFSGSEGIMGKTYGILTGRDGSEYDINKPKEVLAFAQEWQVRDDEPMLFRTVRGPQFPAKCAMPEKGAIEKRRLGESSVEKSAAERACSRYAPTPQVFEQCVYDVMAFHDLEIAEAGIY